MNASLRAIPVAVWHIYGYTPRMNLRYSYAAMLDSWAAAINAGERI